MGKIIELRTSSGDINILADALCKAFEIVPEQAHRLKLQTSSISGEGMAHGGPEHIELVELDYSDLSEEDFELIKPFILTIIRLAERLLEQSVKIEIMVKSQSGHISGLFSEVDL